MNRCAQITRIACHKTSGIIEGHQHIVTPDLFKEKQFPARLRRAKSSCGLFRGPRTLQSLGTCHPANVPLRLRRVKKWMKGSGRWEAVVSGQ